MSGGPRADVADLDVGEEYEVRTGRWRGVQALALVGTALGILYGAPLVILTGLVGVAFAAYSRLWYAPEPTLSVRRAVSDDSPRPGDRVRVTLSVRNEGDRVLPDVRLCDDVPAGLRVVDGTPRHTTALRPGKTATIAYDVEAVRGEHVFEGLTVVTRDVSGASRRVARLPTADTTVTCRPAYGEHAATPGDLATLLAGRDPVGAVGAGVEFHSLREYQRGDPLGSVDWTRLAKTGDLATRRYDEPRTVRVVLLVDARRPAYVAPDDRRRPAVDVCAHAAGALAAGLDDGGARVGLAALSPRECWVPPGNGTAHRERLLADVTTHEAFGWDPPTSDGDDAAPAGWARGIRRSVGPDAAAPGTPALPEGGAGADDRSLVSDGGAPPGDAEPDNGERGRDDGVREAARATLSDVRTRLPVDAQVVFLTPLADEVSAAVARRLDAIGHDVVVASPDVTATDSPARRLAALERRHRVAALRRQGLAVSEWTPPADPTETAGWAP